MIPVDQTGFVASMDAEPAQRGNCMQAAFASLLELPLDAVPNFINYGEEWWSTIQEWVAEHGHWIAITHEPTVGALGLMSGKSPRGDWTHLVVSRGADLAHDPHPDRSGVLDPSEWWYLVPLDPAAPPAPAVTS